jgi:hypothetical protein
MNVLKNLAGTSIKEMPCFFIRSTRGIKKITPTLAATAAGSEGAINIWLDDDMKFRCEAMRFGKTVEGKAFSDVLKTEQWTRKWIKRIVIEKD